MLTCEEDEIEVEGVADDREEMNGSEDEEDTYTESDKLAACEKHEIEVEGEDCETGVADEEEEI